MAFEELATASRPSAMPLDGENLKSGDLPLRHRVPFEGREDNPYSYSAEEVRTNPAEQRGIASDGRSILFADPATSYKNNLIYYRDS